MPLSAHVVNGELVYNTTETTSTGNTNTKAVADGKSSMDKDAFLQLLVAQMKYQDPLEPTSNTEYISQFTTFSELEQMQNMSSSMDLQRASNLVGQYVLINHTSETTGEITQIMGKVDYVFYEGGKPYLHVKDNDYSLDELDSIIDASYYNATGLSADFIASFSKLPMLGDLTLGYADVIGNLRAVYNDMDAYQRSFVPADYVNRLGEYEARISQLQAEASVENEEE
ncbi:MAG: flagellar hook capping protein [Lachnospiraceae bacterium]|nr:flagellar hook capping protein [Lachnospiraceae bacterium]